MAYGEALVSRCRSYAQFIVLSNMAPGLTEYIILQTVNLCFLYNDEDWTSNKEERDIICSADASWSTDVLVA